MGGVIAYPIVMDYDLDTSFYPHEVSPDAIIHCDILEVRNDIPIYGPPTARTTLAKHVLRIIIGFFDHLTILLSNESGRSLLGTHSENEPAFSGAYQLTTDTA